MKANTVAPDMSDTNIRAMLMNPVVIILQYNSKLANTAINTQDVINMVDIFANYINSGNTTPQI